MSARGFVYADPDKCIGCQTCMAACLRAHERGGESAGSRLQLVTTLRVSAPVGCHHCIDAPCVRSCPTGCLYADNGRVGIREEKCIGCQNCVLACPFGAVTIAARPRIESFGGVCVEAGLVPVVIKCDLCVNRSRGPACVEACPTGGLYFADQEFISEETGRKRVLAAEAAEPFASLSPTVSMS